MPKSGRTTTEEGYGWAHQQARAQLIRDLVDGDPCTRCWGPMYRWQASLPPDDPDGLDADHHRSSKPDPPDALAHRSCNRAAGAREGNARRAHPQQAGTVPLTPRLRPPRVPTGW